MAVIGIDLGTTNSLAAVWRDGRTELLPNSLGSYLTPSIVSLEADNHILVGQTAKERAVSCPESTAMSFKRSMGTSKSFSLKDGKKKKTFTPEELSALVLKKIREDAEAYLGETVEEAIISVPAYFNNEQRYATKVAAKMAGIRCERIINEPSAAALACRFRDGRGTDEREDAVYLVVDFGGGTLDVSIVECFENIVEIVSIAGDNHLGGIDFDWAVAEEFCRRNALSLEGLSPALRAVLLKRAEQCKQRLSESERAALVLETGDAVYSMEIDNGDLIKMTEKELGRMKKVIEKALRDAEMGKEDITNVLLVGGSSKMPAVQNYISYLWGRKITSEDEADFIIAKGLGAYVGIRERKKDIRDILLTDVCPFSLGTNVINTSKNGKGGIMSVLIERNHTLPCTEQNYFVTVKDGQTELQFDIYQGESYYVEDNLKIGTLCIPVRKAPAGEAGAQLSFTYDINGILQVRAVSEKGERSGIFVSNNARLTEKEIETYTEEMNRMNLIRYDEEEIRSVTEIGERLFSETAGRVREYVGWLLQTYNHIAAGGSPAKIKKAGRTFRERLIQIDMQLNRDSFSEKDMELYFNDADGQNAGDDEQE